MTGSISGNTDTLNYNIYTDINYGNVWSTTAVFGMPGNGTNQVFVAFARAPLNQYVTPDNYSDNLTATLTY